MVVHFRQTYLAWPFHTCFSVVILEGQSIFFCWTWNIHARKENGVLFDIFGWREREKMVTKDLVKTMQNEKQVTIDHHKEEGQSTIHASKQRHFNAFAFCFRLEWDDASSYKTHNFISFFFVKMMLFWLKEIFLFFKRSYKFAIFFGSVLRFLYFFQFLGQLHLFYRISFNMFPN